MFRDRISTREIRVGLIFLLLVGGALLYSWQRHRARQEALEYQQNLEKASDIYTPQGTTISGQIADTTEMEYPIAGVSVRLVALDGTEFRRTTDVNGEFEYRGMPADCYLLSISKDGYIDYPYGYMDLPFRILIVEGNGVFFLSLRMTKKYTIVDFLESRVPLYWVLILCVIIVILFFVRTRRS